METEGSNSFDDLLTRYKFPVIFTLVGLVLLVGGVVSSGLVPKALFKSSKTQASETNIVNKRLIKVDISGAVTSPGVYELTDDSRVEELIKLAGGFEEDVNQGYISKSLNLAQKLSDGMKIYIPFEGEAALGSSGVAGVSTEVGMINLNSASLSDLDSLPGIGPVTAQKIVDGRPYQAVEDLLSKKSVTKAVFEKIKDRVSI